MTRSGCRSLISPIARSMRLGLKSGPPQWMSEMCAIWNVRSAAGIWSKCTPGSAAMVVSEAVATMIAVASEMPDFQAYRGQGIPRFANDAELECAKLLDYYGVPWEYEPRTFVLER